MQPFPASSGDLLVDRRLDYAEALSEAGDAAAAAALLADSMEKVPRWVAGWLRLGEFCEAAGDRDGAAAAYGRAVLLDPRDRLGAGLRLDLLRRERLHETMPAAFVEALFDSYAAGFDAALVDRLAYRGPEILCAALPQGRRFARALDLGCGTGLLGQPLRPRCDDLEGWDISAGMLREAAGKGMYDRLDRVNLHDLEAPEAPRWDLIAAADVFNYIGALERITGWVARALVPGGVFAFTAEAGETVPVRLGRQRRFQHSAAYLGDLLNAAGFQNVSIVEQVLRHDRGTPVLSLVVTALAPAGRGAAEGEALAETA